MVSIKLLLPLITISSCFSIANGFSLSSSSSSSRTIMIRPMSLPSTTTTALHAKKKNKNSSSGKGFGKVSDIKPTKLENNNDNDATTTYNEPLQSTTSSSGLSSIETTTSTSFTRPTVDIDPNLSTDERNKEILKQQFGLRTFEERQGDMKAAEKLAEQKAKMQKIKQMKDEDFDIMMIIPPPVLKGIDLFLKTGLAITTTLFILAGIGITAEAWAVSTGNKLPEDVDAFIVNIIEPNFTPMLLVLLGFSISLGIFATAQLGSGSSTYKEQ